MIHDRPNAAADAATRAMARNVADWHDASVRALGIETFRTDSLWWRLPGGSPIYVGAITLEPDSSELRAGLRMVQDAWGAEAAPVYDGWNTHRSESIDAELLWKNPWYLRQPAPFDPPALPANLSIERVTTCEGLEAFERATVEGFGDSADALRGHVRFSQHSPATLHDPGMHYLMARVDGRVVASTIAHVTGDMLGIYGLSTLVGHRRRGYARALVHASVALRPDLAASVFPDPPSVPIYTDVAFRPAGEIAVWKTR